MKASLVIPTYNSKDLLVPCLVSLNHQRLGTGDEFEVVLVDDGSTDGTAAVVDTLPLEYPIRTLHLPRTDRSCRSAARNAGIAAASAEVIVFADGDQLIDPGFIAEHLRAHRYRMDLVVIGFRDYLRPGAVDIDRLTTSFTTDAFPAVEAPDERTRVIGPLSGNLGNLETAWHFLYGCNVSVRKEHLLAVDAFDENIRRWSFEDVELGFRLHQHGLSFVYTPFARVYHQAHPESARERYADWLENFAYFTSKHPDLVVRLQGVLDDYFDPAKQGPDWHEAYLRFEFACRAAAGRLPLGQSFDVLVVDKPSDAEERIEKAGVAGHLVVLDSSDDPDLPLFVQTLRTGNELLYFRNPDRETRQYVANTFGTRAGA